MNKLTCETERYTRAQGELTYREARRAAIAFLHGQGYNQMDIAAMLDVSQATVHRDILHLEASPEEEASILLKKGQEVIDATDTTLLIAMYREREAVLHDFQRKKLDMNKIKM